MIDKINEYFADEPHGLFQCTFCALAFALVFFSPVLMWVFGDAIYV